MFKKKMVITSLFLLPLIGLWLFQLIAVREGDILSYKEMMEKQQLASSSQNSPTNQIRKGVQKDIWFSAADQQRLHYRIISDSSTLTLTPIQNRIEVIETLKDIKCWMQDKLVSADEPTQQMRYVEADNGIYRYSTQEFKANDVALSLFRLPGHDLPKSLVNDNSPFLQGVAESVSLVLYGKTPQFTANQFKATVIKE